MGVALTTQDNPYDPLDQFDEWNHYDMIKGYQTCGYLARIALTSENLTDRENEQEVERAVDAIVKHGLAIDNQGNISKYIKVKHD